MPVEAGLRSYLLTLAGVTDLVGQDVFDGEAPETVTTPYVVCLRSGTNKPVSMAGDTGITQVTIDVHCVGATYKQAKDVAAAIGAPAAAGQGGVNCFGPGVMGGVPVEGCFVGDEKDPDPILSAELAALKRFATIVPLEIWHT